jgi:hypothetical protein
MVRRRPPPVCPVCGERVPPQAQACPECGACHESGWKEDAEVYDGVDFLDEGVDEGGGKVRWGKSPGMHPFWRVIAIVVVLALFWWLLRTVFVAGRAPWW